MAIVWPQFVRYNCTKSSAIRPDEDKIGVLNMGKNQHVVPRGTEWAVRGEGNTRATSIHETQGDAVDAAREIARNQHSEIVIHRPNGQIRDKDSHGHDSFPPRG
jgi:uncharacterized protein YdaT